MMDFSATEVKTGMREMMVGMVVSYALLREARWIPCEQGRQETQCAVARPIEGSKGPVQGSTRGPDAG